MHRQERPREDCEPKLIKRDGSDVTDWSWCSPANTSCWDKFHEFYQPNGLFNSYWFIDKATKKCKFAQCAFTSSLNQKKYKALGVTVNYKNGHSVGMGSINRDLLMKGTVHQGTNEKDYSDEGKKDYSDESKKDYSDESN
jgi:hypothetical protein